jgi:hypothetical protein
VQALKAALGKNLGLADGVSALTGCLPGKWQAAAGLSVLNAVAHVLLAPCVHAGAVPPFGSLFSIGAVTYMDPSLQEQGPDINFNAVRVERQETLRENWSGIVRATTVTEPKIDPFAMVAASQGLRTRSVAMSIADFIAVEKPVVLSFTMA